MQYNYAQSLYQQHTLENQLYFHHIQKKKDSPFDSPA